MNKFSLLAEASVASIRDIQKNPSRVLRNLTRVTRGSKTVGFFLSTEEFAELIENQEAVGSKPFTNRVARARRAVKTKKLLPLQRLARQYGAV